jgi:NADH dehydrogenase
MPSKPAVVAAECSSALLHWTIAFLGRGRPERTVTEQQGLARVTPPSLPLTAQDVLASHRDGTGPS